MALSLSLCLLQKLAPGATPEWNGSLGPLIPKQRAGRPIESDTGMNRSTPDSSAPRLAGPTFRPYHSRRRQTNNPEFVGQPPSAGKSNSRGRLFHITGDGRRHPVPWNGWACNDNRDKTRSDWQ